MAFSVAASVDVGCKKDQGMSYETGQEASTLSGEDSSHCIDEIHVLLYEPVYEVTLLHRSPLRHL